MSGAAVTVDNPTGTYKITGFDVNFAVSSDFVCEGFFFELGSMAATACRVVVQRSINTILKRREDL